jgi:hypothetical protein
MNLDDQGIPSTANTQIKKMNLITEITKYAFYAP